MHFIAILLAAAVPAEAPKAMTAQQQFDAASIAQTQGRCDAAINGFEALEARIGTPKNPKVLATIKIRKGACLAAIGRPEEAARIIALALPLLNANDPIERLDIARARIALGKIAYLQFDYPRAKAELLAARNLLSGEDQLDCLIWLAWATMFDPGDESIAYAEAAITIAQNASDVKRKDLAPLHTLHARALLNHGRHAEAYAELKKALAAQGGLTQRVNLADVVTRSDLALAAMLNRDLDSAREYLAYTGAGRFEKSPFNRAARMDLPACGGASDIRPDDFAVVEFSIKDDGSVGYAAPIYASRNGHLAVEFAQAVADWSWRPEDARAIPGLFRQATRLELRCSIAAEKPYITNELWEALKSWLAERKVQPLPVGNSDAERWTIAKSELARRTAQGGGVTLVPALLSLAGNPIAADDEVRESLAQTSQLLENAGAPIAARVFVQIRNADHDAGGFGDGSRRRSMLREILNRPEVKADPRAASILRILVAEGHYRSRAPADAAELLGAVVGDERLPRPDPLRIGALMRLASLQAAAGDLASARKSFAETGLDAQQCALVDARPTMKRTGASSSDFPQEAMHWGFEGWVSVEFDIRPDGRTIGQRAIAAYPPLVFRDAALGVMKGSLYEQSYRPEGSLGCGGAQQTINFRIPK